MNLNESQKQAVCHKTGPMLVLAGPGSGKTRVITERTAHLILHQGIDPCDILVVTFTKAAAKEMKERFCQRMGEKYYPVTFGTFHGIFFGILKHAYGLRGDNIIREEQKYQFMKELVRKFQVEFQDEKEIIGDLLGEISFLKNTSISLEHYYPKSVAKDIFLKIYTEYQRKMQAQRLIDFDDMLVYCYELLTNRKDILEGWQARYQYILVDEFQDINHLQFEIVKLLAKPQDNLFVVGDDDQSIYRFRGAKPEIMLGFQKVFPEAKQVLLDVNYRCQKEIVKSAITLINYNQQRFPKKILAQREGKVPIEIREFPDQYQENRYLIEKILKYHKNGSSYGEMAVLFRTNTQPRLLMELLMNYNIPFHTRDKIPNLYDHWIARDILTYLRIAMGSREVGDFLQIMNRPLRYISRESLEETKVDFQNWADYFYQLKQPWLAERIHQLEADLKVLSRISPFAAVNYIRGSIGYEEYLREYAKQRKINAQELIDVLEELQNSAKEYETYQAWLTHMEEYEKELKQVQQQQEYNQESVSLATLHSAKGLEYEIVFMIDVNEGVMPYKKALLQAELEEERRMFYVGITRAKDNLHIYHSKKINGKDTEPSRFLREMLEERKQESNTKEKKKFLRQKKNRE